MMIEEKKPIFFFNGASLNVLLRLSIHTILVVIVDVNTISFVSNYYVGNPLIHWSFQ
jgi:hypothetical protein